MGEREWGRVEVHRVAPVVGAVGREHFEVEVLALGHAHVDEMQNVHREDRVLTLAREHLEVEPPSPERREGCFRKPPHNPQKRVRLF